MTDKPPLDLEAEYNNRAAVPDHPAVMARWKAEAEVTRAAEPPTVLRYGPGPRETIDLFEAGPGAPVVAFLHGGYWQALDRSWFSHLARGFVARGVALALPSYDLCPRVSLAELVEQVRGAAAFLVRRHERPVLAGGHSAGGHLAAMLLATDWAARGLAPDAVHAAYAISGLFDLPPLLSTAVNDALGLDAETARRLSPLFLPAPGRPFYAAVGGTEGEEYLRQTRSIAAAWGGTWDVLPGANHFTAIAPLADPSSPLLSAILDTTRAVPR